MRSTAYKIHKYVSLTLAVLWLVQILTGVVAVFAPEMTAAKIDKPLAALNPEAFEASLNAFDKAHPDWEPGFIFTTSRESTRFDVYFHNTVSDDLGYRAVRIDGDGEIVADRMMKDDFFSFILNIHESLLIDGYGPTILGISGIFLLTNLILGIQMIWPQRKKWGSFFKLSLGVPIRIKLYNWHRLLGLCVAVPAVLVVATGVLLIWFEEVKGAVGDPWADPVVPAVPDLASKQTVSIADAMHIALKTYPAARLSILSTPSVEEPYYMIRLLQDGEIREIFGNTKIYISAVDGSILANYDQLNAPVRASILSSFFSIHLGNAIGLPGRILAFVTGIILLVMSGVGIALWWKRRPQRA
ncbi:PepSY-associated TM helix domain-containing protein [Kordiimonas pumila]|uniref:PepSY-associated TM helix domain-containing protein n=1 Tax=Kordiimonas pumila TaxID=2161677 RepID=A0ABV7D0T2_9PROT|nr:PepSY-associated TM helix domain-containing protein [Kordiimonas pumila]